MGNNPTAGPTGPGGRRLGPARTVLQPGRGGRGGRIRGRVGAPNLTVGGRRGGAPAGPVMARVGRARRIGAAGFGGGRGGRGGTLVGRVPAGGRFQPAGRRRRG